MFWCWHALPCLCRYIILNYSNIHQCGLRESFMSVLSVCALRTAWQLVPYITTSQPHTHICAPHTRKRYTHIRMQKYKYAITNGNTQTDKNINIQTAHPLYAFFYPAWTFQLNYLILSLHETHSISLIVVFFLCVWILCILSWQITTSDTTSQYIYIYISWYMPPVNTFT